jgi:hypothetical protein
MQAHRAIVILATHVIQGADLDDPCVVDKDVNPVELIDDLPNRGLNLVAIEQIAFNNEDFSATRSEISFGTREFFWIPREESDISSLFTNVSRQDEAQPARSATDQGNFIAQRVSRRTNDASRYPTAE